MLSVTAPHWGEALPAAGQRTPSTDDPIEGDPSRRRDRHGERPSEELSMSQTSATTPVRPDGPGRGAECLQRPPGGVGRRCRSLSRVRGPRNVELPPLLLNPAERVIVPLTILIRDGENAPNASSIARGRLPGRPCPPMRFCQDRGLRDRPAKKRRRPSSRSLPRCLRSCRFFSAFDFCVRPLPDRLPGRRSEQAGALLGDFVCLGWHASRAGVLVELGGRCVVYPGGCVCESGSR